MSAQASQSTRLGRYVETPVGGEIVRAFVPPPLPPRPEIDLLPLLDRLSAAERALGRLDGAPALLPRQGPFLSMFPRARRPCFRRKSRARSRLLRISCALRPRLGPASLSTIFAKSRITS